MKILFNIFLSAIVIITIGLLLTMIGAGIGSESGGTILVIVAVFVVPYLLKKIWKNKPKSDS